MSGVGYGLTPSLLIDLAPPVIVVIAVAETRRNTAATDTAGVMAGLPVIGRATAAAPFAVLRVAGFGLP